MFKKAVLAGNLLKIFPEKEGSVPVTVLLEDFYEEGSNPNDYWISFIYEGEYYDINLGIGTDPEEYPEPYCSLFPLGKDENDLANTGFFYAVPLELEKLDTLTARKYLGEKYAGESVEDLSDEDKLVLIRLLCNLVESDNESKERLIKSCNALETIVISQRKELDWFNRMLNYSMVAVTLMVLWGLFQ